MDFENRRYDSIQALRGIAAFSVLLNHIAFVSRGGFGVDIFFCISGFIMIYVTEKSTEHFLIKRIIRVVPLYYLITFITVLGMIIMPEMFEASDIGFLEVVKSILFVPFNNAGVIQPIVRVGWTLNYEMFFYVIVFACIHINKKYRAYIAAFILILFAVVGKLFPSENVIYTFYTDSIIVEFAFGIMAYELLKNNQNIYCNINKGVRAVMLIAAGLLYSVMWIPAYMDFFGKYDRYLYYGIPGFLLFILVFTACYGINVPRFPVWLGNISFSMYLIHYFIIRGYNRLFCADGKITVFNFVIALIVICIILCISHISYYFFEKKIKY